MRYGFQRPHPVKPATIPPGGEAIARAITDAGLCYSFARHGSNSEGYTVYAFRSGDSCFRRLLGSFAVVAALSDEALRATIAAKFPARSATE